METQTSLMLLVVSFVLLFGIGKALAPEGHDKVDGLFMLRTAQARSIGELLVIWEPIKGEGGLASMIALRHDVSSVLWNGSGILKSDGIPNELLVHLLEAMQYVPDQLPCLVQFGNRNVPDSGEFAVWSSGPKVDGHVTVVLPLTRDSLPYLEVIV